MKNILFLCTGNSCRSQMAEGLAKKLKGDIFTAYSAGIKSHGLNPFAIKVMAEIGIDITKQKSKTIEEVINIPFDRVITLCSHAFETCPVFPQKVKIEHVGFDDPPTLAKNVNSEEEILKIYRRVRDEIRDFVERLS